MKLNSQTLCRSVIVAAGLLIACFVVLRVGLGATAYDTADRMGRTMGFNDSLNGEHYAIMVRHFSPAGLLQFEYAYEWVLFAMFAWGCRVLFSRSRFGRRSTRWFFAAQGVLFPVAWIGIIALPGIVKAILTGRMDREGFIDIPFLWVTAHTVWLLASLTIVLAMPGESLGIKTTVRALCEAGSRLCSVAASRLK